MMQLTIVNQDSCSILCLNIWLWCGLKVCIFHSLWFCLENED
jgi:hypothetical protein